MKLVAVILITLLNIATQSDGDRIMTAVRSAMAPALPFPDTTEDGAVPANGNTEVLWMVRPLQAGDRSIEVIANPLNEANQLKAARAMAQIENNIQAAQRRAAQQYDRAVAEAKRTGKSQEVDGVTLADEGVAGAKIDAESHVVIDVLFNQPSYSLTIISSVQPQAMPTRNVPGLVIGIPSNTYRDDRAEHFAEAETLVFLGSVAPATLGGPGGNTYVLTASSRPSSAPVQSLVIRLRGNEQLLAELLEKTDWQSLLELTK